MTNISLLIDVSNSIGVTTAVKVGSYSIVGESDTVSNYNKTLPNINDTVSVTAKIIVVYCDKAVEVRLDNVLVGTYTYFSFKSNTSSIVVNIKLLSITTAVSISYSN